MVQKLTVPKKENCETPHMSEAAYVDGQWRVLGEAVARLSEVRFGNVNFRLEDGRFTGLIEIRYTLHVEDQNK